MGGQGATGAHQAVEQADASGDGAQQAPVGRVEGHQREQHRAHHKEVLRRDALREEGGMRVRPSAAGGELVRKAVRVKVGGDR